MIGFRTDSPLVKASWCGLILSISGCAENGRASDAFVVRDSAGVEIVESSSGLWGDEAAWIVAGEPMVEIGMVDGPPEYQLDGVIGAALLPDDRVVVADAGSRELRVYDPTGRHLVSFGRAGAGPGEFQSMNWLGVRGDSVVAWDPRAKRLSVFSTDEGLIGSVPVPALAEAFFPVAIGMTPDGRLIASPGDDPRAMMSAPEGEYRPERVYLVIDADGAVTDTIASFPSAENVLRRVGEGVQITGILFGRETHLDVTGERLVAGYNGSFELLVLGLDGSIERIIRRAHDPVVVTEEDLERERELVFQAYRGIPPGLVESTRSLIAESDHRSTRPAFADLIVDAEGNVWVEESRRPGDEQPRWSVFETSGRWLGMVDTPRGLRIVNIGSDRIVGVWRDELDVEHVRVHTLEKS